MSAHAQPWRWTLQLAAIGVLITLGTQAFRIGMADLLAAKRPIDAIEWWPSQAEARSRELQRLVEQPDAEARARHLAVDMLATSPLSGTAYAGLGRLAEARGDRHKAASLFAIAAARSPRERSTHAWLADWFVSDDDFPKALRHFDQILRLSPRQAHAILPALESLATHPRGVAAVADHLGEHAPPWRERFLASWAARAPSEQLLDSVFDPLRESRHPLTAAERDLWVTRLVQQDRVTKAHYLWIDGLPVEHRQQIGNVFDGGFELPTSNGGFGWRLGRVPGASIRLQGGGGVEGMQALMVEFQNRRVPFQHVQQMLALPPGDYRLSGRARLDDIRSERGLRWTITCAKGGAVLAETERFSGRRTWSPFHMDFMVPAEKCAAQILLLRLDARIPAEQWIGGRAWFDGLRVIRRHGDGQVASESVRGGE